MIEFLREKNIEAALKWLREELSPLRDVPTTHSGRESYAVDSLTLTETVALLAYKNPENSELGKLHFDLSRRHLVADLINQDIITTGLGLPPWSSVHVLLRHIVICRRMMHRRNLERGPIISCRQLCYPIQKEKGNGGSY